MKRTCLISLFIFCLLPVFSQNVLKGVIVDTSNMAVPDATVRILTADSVFVGGGITDGKGAFLYDGIKKGRYILVVSCIGYINSYLDFDMPDSDYEISSITLKTDNILLNGVTVTGSSFIRKKDHLLIIPDRNQIKHSFTGYDLLYNLMIPGLTIDRKNKTVNTMVGEAVLYINGVKADIREVQNLRPRDIEKVEYYSMPASGQFVGDAASINYITKVHETGGYVTVDGEQNIGYLKGNYNLGAKVSHQNTHYTLFGGYTMEEFDGIENEKDEGLLFPDYEINRTTANKGADYKNNQQYAQFKVNNDTKKRNLSAAASFVRDVTPRNNRNKLLNYTGYEERMSSLSECNDDKNMKSAINLNGIFKLNEKKELKIRLNGAYSRNAYNRTYVEEKQKSISNAKEDLYSFDAQVAYRYQPNAKKSFYGRVTHFHNITSSLYGGDYDSWQHLWKGETLFQLDYTHVFNERLMMMMSPGASWLNYKLHGTDLQTLWNVRFNVAMRYAPHPKHSVMLGGAIGNNQPSISYLNTANQTIDFYQIKRGNLYLDNTKVYSVMALYEGNFHRLLNVQCKLTYVDNVDNVYTNYFVEGDKLISSYASDRKFRTLSADLALSSRISDNLRTNVYFKYGYMSVPEVSGLNYHNYSVAFDVNYFIKSFAVNVHVRSMERVLDGTILAFMKSPASYGLFVRYSKKNWMAEVGTENPFTRKLCYREYADYGVYRYNQIKTSRIYQQTGYVKLAYTFDFGKKTSRENNNVDRSINSAILKVE